MARDHGNLAVTDFGEIVVFLHKSIKSTSYATSTRENHHESYKNGGESKVQQYEEAVRLMRSLFLQVRRYLGQIPGSTHPKYPACGWSLAYGHDPHTSHTMRPEHR